MIFDQKLYSYKLSLLARGMLIALFCFLLLSPSKSYSLFGFDLIPPGSFFDCPEGQELVVQKPPWWSLAPPYSLCEPIENRGFEAHPEGPGIIPPRTRP